MPGLCYPLIFHFDRNHVDICIHMKMYVCLKDKAHVTCVECRIRGRISQ